MASLVERLVALEATRMKASAELGVLTSQLEEITQELLACGITVEDDLVTLRAKCEALLVDSEQRILAAEKIIMRLK
jgi:hypothetical protein